MSGSGDAPITATDLGVFHGDYRPYEAQQPPPGNWSTWLILAGRGYGKTRTGAAWIDEMAQKHHGVRIALVGATHHDARSVMVDGEAGLRAVNPDIEYQPGVRRLYWPRQGSSATLYSAEEPETLRGPAFGFAWGDEAARWPHAEALLANLRMALRGGAQPQLLLTTTPLPLAWLKDLTTARRVVTTRGRTFDNRGHLPEAFVDDIVDRYGGTRLGRQELDGEFVEDREGALWNRALLDAARVDVMPQLLRIVVAVDPPAGEGSMADACGIIVAGLGIDGLAYVVADHSVQGLAPEGWAAAVVSAAGEWDADLVVAEANNGGKMVGSMLKSLDAQMNLRLVYASHGKVTRAEPVSALYVRGKVRHAAAMPALEDELCGLGAGGGWAGSGRSPDRADALVWALTELMLGKRRAEPGVRGL